ncbi:MAG: flippase-like domain-containing protein [Acidimicrobiales bacterium]
MTQISPVDVGLGPASTDGNQSELAPPGERYFRHPGDVIRLVLWAATTLAVVLFIGVATGTSDGVTADLGRAARQLPTTFRELLLALVQVVAVVVPVTVVAALGVTQRWRRLGIVVGAAVAGAVALWALDTALDLSDALPGAVTNGTWVASPRFPSLAYVSGAVAAGTVGKPWLARPWRRALDRAVLALVIVLAVGGTAGVPELLLAVAAGATAGSVLLVAFGAPNRRPAPAVVRAALRDAGVDAVGLSLVRAEEGRSQLYTTTGPEGRGFVKVYAQDSRDADLLFRGYRKAVLRDAGDEASASLSHDVEHEALLLMLAQRAGVTCPAVSAVVELPDGSMVLALEHVQGRTLDALEPGELDEDLLDAVWREAATLHAGRLAHRALHASNIMVRDHLPVLVDLGAAQESAGPRLQALDRAELLASLVPLAGADAAVGSARRVIGPDGLATALPYLQPLALSASTRRTLSKPALAQLREAAAAAAGIELPPLERLVRVRPKTLLTIAALAGAFYVMLPQLANVDDSFEAMGSANWWWLLAAAVLSIVTYLASAVGLVGGVAEPLPFGPMVLAQMASSFVNRVTPANVGGMALNVRFMQKAGVDAPSAVTGMGLSVLAGGIVHVILLVVFFAWAGQSGANSFELPLESKVLVIIAVLLAVVGVGAATRWGRRVFRKHVVVFLQRSWRNLCVLSHSPSKLLCLVLGSFGVTLAYVCALASAVAAFNGDVTFAEVGAVYLGASMIAAAAPTPGGLGALEAGLVAGFTGVGLDPGVAVAAVLSYRLVTYWLPILPGWISFHVLERRDLI